MIENKIEKSQGITLIALVVTIIVLLILAGISINALTGQNGILKRATDAKKQTEDAGDLEYLQTKAYEGVTEYYLDGKTGSETEYILQKLNELDEVTTNLVQETVTYKGKTYYISQIAGNSNEKNAIESQKELTQITVANATSEEDKKLLAETDEDGNAKLRMIIVVEKTGNGTVKAVIPSGFYYVTGTPTTGLVISDKYGDDDNNSKGGNQFVWVPCNGGEAVYEKHVYETNIVDDTEGYTQDTGNEMWPTFQYRKYNDWKDEDNRTVKNTSVAKYGGFYVGRYEAGISENADFYNNEDGSVYWQSSYNEDTSIKYGDNDFKEDLSKTYIDTYKVKDITTQNNKNLVPVSKKNNPSWNYISQKNANIVSNNMYETSKTVKSYLIDGVAWDTISNWISNDKKDIKNVIDSTAWGNYLNSEYQINGLYAKHQIREITKGEWKWFPAYMYNRGIHKKEKEYIEIATGSTERNRAKKIYDLSGNMWEWTTEVGDHTSLTDNSTIISGKYAVLRGGSFKYNGDRAPVTYRHGINTSSWSGDINVGFRVVLYIAI